MASQTLSSIIQQLRQALDLEGKITPLKTGQQFISGALTGGMVPAQEYPAPDLETDPEGEDVEWCDAWADTAEAMNNHADWSNYPDPNSGGGA